MFAAKAPMGYIQKIQYSLLKFPSEPFCGRKCELFVPFDKLAFSELESCSNIYAYNN